MIEESVSHNKPSGYSYFVAADFSGVYAGEYPMWTWSESQGREKLAQYLNFGIRCFLDLTMPGEMPPYQPYLPAVEPLHKPRGMGQTRAVPRTPPL